MAYSFGLDAGISRNTNNTVEHASVMDENGVIVEEETFGGIEEITEESSLNAAFSNEALNGQTGIVSAGVVTAHSLVESNNDFSRVSKTTRKPLAAGI